MPAIMDQIGPNHPPASLEGSTDSSTSAPPSALEDHLGANAQETSRFLTMRLEVSDWGEIWGVSPNDPSEGRHPVIPLEVPSSTAEVPRPRGRELLEFLHTDPVEARAGLPSAAPSVSPPSIPLPSAPSQPDPVEPRAGLPSAAPSVSPPSIPLPSAPSQPPEGAGPQALRNLGEDLEQNRLTSEQANEASERPPILSKGTARRTSIVEDTPARFVVRDNPHARPVPFPWYSKRNEEQVSQYADIIESAAQRHNLDPDFLKAIVWIETTHGWYDSYSRVFREPKTLRPMNVHVEFWKDLGFSRKDLQDPNTNIEVGAYILAQLWVRTENPTPEKVATLYNNLFADKVSQYGKTVGIYYRWKPWR